MTPPSYCLNGELWYLQHNCVGDTIVYHYESNLIQLKLVAPTCLYMSPCLNEHENLIYDAKNENSITALYWLMYTNELTKNVKMHGKLPSIFRVNHHRLWFYYYVYSSWSYNHPSFLGIIQGMRPANERWHSVMLSLIGRVPTQNDPYIPGAARWYDLFNHELQNLQHNCPYEEDELFTDSVHFL